MIPDETDAWETETDTIPRICAWCLSPSEPRLQQTGPSDKLADCSDVKVRPHLFTRFLRYKGSDICRSGITTGDDA